LYEPDIVKLALRFGGSARAIAGSPDKTARARDRGRSALSLPQAAQAAAGRKASVDLPLLASGSPRSIPDAANAWPALHEKCASTPPDAPEISKKLRN
jgi:hypothetical protein